jgi:hypothetical protein
MPFGVASFFNRVHLMLRDSLSFRRRRVGIVRPFLRGLLACCALVFFASTFALSISPTRPYLKKSTRSGYFSKISRASEAGVEGAGQITTEDQPPKFVAPPTKNVCSVDREIPVLKVPGVLRLYYFRPPPLN